MNTKSNLLQIQPQYALFEQWAALSQEEGLFYEVLEFYSPPSISDVELHPTLEEWYRTSGRATSVHGAFIDVNPASGDPAFKELSRRRCRESCQLAKALGAEHVVLHGSCFPFLRGVYLDSWVAQCADFYTQLAEEYDLAIHIENSQDVDTTPLARLMQRIEDKRVSVCLDIGHANYSLAPIEQWFDDLGEYIRYLHLSDNLGHFDDHLPIGAGAIDWAKTDALWRKLQRPTPMTLEVGGIPGVKKSLAFLREHDYFDLGSMM